MKQTQTQDTAIIIMKTMETGFTALANEQRNQKNQINTLLGKVEELKREFKNEMKASYNACTKEGKSRYVLAKNKQGKSPQKIADELDFTIGYIKKHIREAKRNGK